MPETPRRTLELVHAESLSPTVRLFRFRLQEDAPFSYVAGQWVNLFVPVGEREERRSYSIASAPKSDEHGRGLIDIAITKVSGGPVSCALHELRIGATLEMDGPWGFFTRERAPRDEPAVFVGTGTGLSPLRAMLQEEVQRTDGPPLVLLFGCRTEADMLWHDELREWQKLNPRFRFEPTLSRPSDTWQGRRGYVQEHIQALLAPLLPAHVYICGLSDMVHAVRTLLKEEMKLPRQVVHTERYD
jgi:NAD(P)H-flavin reductase